MRNCFQKSTTISQNELKKKNHHLSPVVMTQSQFKYPVKAVEIGSMRSQSIPRPITSPGIVKPKEIKFQINNNAGFTGLNLRKVQTINHKPNKVFIVLGEYPELKKALTERG